MNLSNQKFSLRGSLANDIAKRLQSSSYGADLSNILDDIFRSNPDDLVCISDGGMIIVGKKSDRGKFSPDW
jgi:hypothetical protein